MTSVEVRDILNKPQLHFNVAVRTLTDYILQPVKKVIVVNYIVSRAKQTKNFTTIDLLKFFIEKTEYLTENTRLCKTKYASQMLLKSTWETSRLQQVVIQQIRNNYAMLEAEPEKELTKKEKQILQAKLMREAKAKKAEERRKLEQAKKQAKLKQEVEDKVKVKETKSKYSEEQLNQIELLKNLH